ncbi:MAG TPA: hypothetical protein VFW64_15345 [Pseudonocardiaceae bacterium]|nr:hypothetical protein [Pseudonocardiaceae bacterium]
MSAVRLLRFTTNAGPVPTSHGLSRDEDLVRIAVPLGDPRASNGWLVSQDDRRGE